MATTGGTPPGAPNDIFVACVSTVHSVILEFYVTRVGSGSHTLFYC